MLNNMKIENKAANIIFITVIFLVSLGFVYTLFFAPDPKKDFFKALDTGDLNKIRHLLINDVSLLKSKKNGVSPLHYAVSNNNKRVVELILDIGADVNSKSGRHNSTALMIAASRGRKEIATLLLTKGADVNARNDYGKTALMSAAASGNIDVLELLIDNNANINIRCADGGMPSTALEYAVEYTHPQAVTFLLKNGADISNIDKLIRMTRTHLKGIPDAKEAIKNRYREVIMILEKSKKVGKM